MSGYVLGIDVGTTYTGAAVARDGRVEVVSLGYRSSVVPSVVFLRDDGELLVGEAADRRASQEPDRVAREFKRRMGDPTPLMLAGTPFSPEALTARVLRTVYDQVVELQGEEPERLVLSHPANWGPYKTDLLAHAVRLAGLDAALMVTEPQAAAWYYASREKLEPGEVMAVYDLGGGTFDVAVMRRTDDGFEIVGTPEGIDRLGGIDIDEAVFAQLREALPPEAIDRLTDGSEESMMVAARLRRDCVDAKEALSRDDEAVIPIMLPEVKEGIRITREELEASIRPMLSDTIDALRRALDSAEVTPDDLAVVLVVGGSSRLPIVAEMITEQLGRPVAVDAHPKHACALGAALVGEAALAVEAGRSAQPLVVVPPRPTDPPAEGASSGNETATFAAPVGPPSGDAPESDDASSGADEPGSPGGFRRWQLVAALLAVVAVVAGIFVVTSGGGDDEPEALEATTVAPVDSTLAETDDVATTAVDTTAPTETTTPESDDAEDGAGADADADGEDGRDASGNDVILTAGEIFLEPLAEETDDPFTESVAAEASPELLAFAALGGPAADGAGDDGAATTVPATTVADGSSPGPTSVAALGGTDPGVFGGSRNEQTCDPELLVESLGRRPAEAAAWAGVFDIEVDEIPDYVDKMTAVNLTADTRVTNHGLVEGIAVARQSVLQVGTAVLVDEFGVPSVRCSSGSPLLPPEAVEGTTAYVGPAWETFDPATTAIVAPAPDPAAEFVLFDVAGGDTFIRPAGTSGAEDRELLPGEILATGEVNFQDAAGASIDTNVMEIIFQPTGGPITGTFEYSLSFEGISIVGSGDLDGTFDPATLVMSGSGFGTATATGGFEASGGGGWSANVDPAAGTITGIAGDEGGGTPFALTFEPYTPPPPTTLPD